MLCAGRCLCPRLAHQSVAAELKALPSLFDVRTAVVVPYVEKGPLNLLMEKLVALHLVAAGDVKATVLVFPRRARDRCQADPARGFRQVQAEAKHRPAVSVVANQARLSNFVGLES